MAFGRWRWRAGGRIQREGMVCVCVEGMGGILFEFDCFRERDVERTEPHSLTISHHGKPSRNACKARAPITLNRGERSGILRPALSPAHCPSQFLSVRLPLALRSVASTPAVHCAQKIEARHLPRNLPNHVDEEGAAQIHARDGGAVVDEDPSGLLAGRLYKDPARLRR
jgi:hypothetical protein